MASLLVLQADSSSRSGKWKSDRYDRFEDPKMMMTVVCKQVVGISTRILCDKLFPCFVFITAEIDQPLRLSGRSSPGDYNRRIYSWTAPNPVHQMQPKWGRQRRLLAARTTWNLGSVAEKQSKLHTAQVSSLKLRTNFGIIMILIVKNSILAGGSWVWRLAGQLAREHVLPQAHVAGSGCSRAGGATLLGFFARFFFYTHAMFRSFVTSVFLFYGTGGMN